MINGLLDLPWWAYIVVTLVLTHITIASVTIFLHRHQAHRALDLHPAVSHFFRLWLWLTTGMVTKAWAAIHRKHHARCETAEDPHSPQILGLNKVLFEGAELYRKEAKNAETLAKYGSGTPDDWLERNVYGRHSGKGVLITLAVDILLFGPIGITMWAVQMIWIPFFAAGIINGVGHYWGYRNFECEDASTNIVPWGILIGGEELHNNHHAYGTSAKLSARWYEFDIGWFYIRTLELLGLAEVKRVAPKLRWLENKANAVDFQTLQAIITHRYDVLKRFTISARRVYREEFARIGARMPNLSRDQMNSVKTWLRLDPRKLPERDRAQFLEILAHSRALQTVFAMRQDLAGLWERSTASREQLLAHLQDWCSRAEESGIASLQEFSRRLRCYA